MTRQASGGAAGSRGVSEPLNLIHRSNCSNSIPARAAARLIRLHRGLSKAFEKLLSHEKQGSCELHFQADNKGWFLREDVEEAFTEIALEVPCVVTRERLRTSAFQAAQLAQREADAQTT